MTLFYLFLVNKQLYTFIIYKAVTELRIHLRYRNLDGVR